jgi:hypothetical protein
MGESVYEGPSRMRMASAGQSVGGPLFALEREGDAAADPPIAEDPEFREIRYSFA